MRKIIKLSVLLFVLGLSSCSSPLKKSVIEPLEIKDLKGIIEKDTLFESTYRLIEKIRNLKLIDDVEKAKWSNMTYANVHEIFKFYSDSTFQYEYLGKIKSDWKNKYGETISKLDSISDYWKKYKKDNSLNNFVSVELFDIETRSNGSPYVGFRISPLKGPIDKLDFHYVFIKKDDKSKKSEKEKFDELNNKRAVQINLVERISKPKIFWEFDFKNEDIIKDNILEEVLDKYVFEIQIFGIIRNGGTYQSKYYLDIPRDIKQMWDYDAEGDDLMFDYYRSDVIKEFINENFISYRSFKYSKIDSIAMVINPTAVQFIDLSYELK
tara:strand:+ start:1447 stop:2418 length:972 start_codon:yes stop_codon:yes gene_type:complete